MSLAPGKELPHYRIVEKIGEGGMGAVWKAVDTQLDREVAIKVVPEPFALDADRLARFEREAKLLGSLSQRIVKSKRLFGLGPASANGHMQTRTNRPEAPNRSILAQ